MLKGPQKSLWVAVVGQPNVGKSVLVNKLVGKKISAVSSKYNTTRGRVLGIRTQGNIQMVFSDTPGYVDPSSGTGYRYVKSLVTAASEAVPSADVVAYVADAAADWGDSEASSMAGMLEKCAHAKARPMLVLNKFDLSTKDPSSFSATCDAVASDFEHVCFKLGLVGVEGFDGKEQDAIVKVSALHGTGLPVLIKALEKRAIARPWDYSPDIATPQSREEIVTEVIREKLFRNLHQEVPYNIVQRMRVCMEDPATNTLVIDQDLIVPSRSYVKILLGRDAGAITAVSKQASIELEKALGRKVRLTLHVSLKPDAPEFRDVRLRNS